MTRRRIIGYIVTSKASAQVNAVRYGKNQQPLRIGEWEMENLFQARHPRISAFLSDARLNQ